MLTVANTVQLAFIKESVWGTTPVTPAFQILRHTGESLKINRETKTSAEITPERNIMDQVHVAGGAEGGFEFELSYGAYDDIFESLLFSTWADNVIKNGVTEKPLSFEKRFLVDTATYSYFRYAGMIANNMSLALSAGDIITGSFDFLGKGGTVADTAIVSSSYNEAETESVLSGSSHIGALTLSGITSPKLLNVNLNVTNNLMSANVLGSLDYAAIGAGQFGVSGNMDIYFNNTSVYSAFLSATEFALSLTLGAETTKKYTIDLPRVKFSGGEVFAEGQNSYVMAKMEFQALGDATEECTMKITRAVV